MNAKELNRLMVAGRNVLADPTTGHPHMPADQEIAHRALSLLAAAEANDGTTPETGALPQSDDKPIKEGAMARILCRRLERERNGLAAEVLRLQEQLQAAENEAHRKDVLLVEAIYGQPCPTQRQWEQMQELVAKAFASRGKP